MTPTPRPRPAGPGLRKVEEPHPIAVVAQHSQEDSGPASQQDSGTAAQLASMLAAPSVVTITHRVPRDLRDRLKIAAIRADRREQDIVAEALGEWLYRQESDG